MNGEIIDGEEPAGNGSTEFFSGLGREIKTAFNERARLVKLEIDTAHEIVRQIEEGLRHLAEEHGMDVGYTAKVLPVGQNDSASIRVSPARIAVYDRQGSLAMAVDIRAASDDGLVFGLRYRDEQKSYSENPRNASEFYKLLPAALAAIIPAQEMSDALVAKTGGAAGGRPKP